MTEVLVLGGTGWLGGLVARSWVARGGRSAPDGARRVVADRDRPGAYDELADRTWDEVIDVSSDAPQVSGAVEALASRAAHWTYVSTVSVYADDTAPGADESAAVVGPLAVGDVVDYPHHKAAAEAAVRSALGSRAAIVRPGLIVGPGDASDRFGYWVGRFALAAGGPVLVPDATGLGVSVIDVADLAEFVVRLGALSRVGTVNAVGDGIPLAVVLDAARAAAGHRGEIIEADPDWLLAHDVAYWMGPRSLPLWLPRESAGHWSRSNRLYRELGGGLRPLSETLDGTLADERARGLGRPRRSGLERADELALISQLGA
jgi:2'-hydroxyisoflavone reductase